MLLFLGIVGGPFFIFLSFSNPTLTIFLKSFLNGKRVPCKDIDKDRLWQTEGRGEELMFNRGWISDRVVELPFSYFIASLLLSLTTLFSISTTGVTVHSASLSSSSSISVSLESTFYKLLASLAGEHGKYFVLLVTLYLCECILKFIDTVIVFVLSAVGSQL